MKYKGGSYLTLDSIPSSSISSTRFANTTTTSNTLLLTVMTDQHWRMQLNNYLQANGGTRLLQWEICPSGPPHQIQWTVVTYIRGIEYARCVGSRQGATMEAAARQTLDALYSDRSGRYY